MPKNSFVVDLQKKLPESILETYMNMIGDYHFQENLSTVHSIHQIVTTNQMETQKKLQHLGLQATEEEEAVLLANGQPGLSWTILQQQYTKQRHNAFLW